MSTGERPDGQQGVARPRILTWDELHSLPRPRQLVRGLLGDGALSVVYGQPGQMKSFVAIDIALHVSTGREWHGHPVEEGGALYIAFEGAGSIADRLEAHRSHYDLDRKDAQLLILPQGIDMSRPDEFFERNVRMVAEHRGLKLIVVDTLNRAMGGGNENSPDDMGRFLACCDALRNFTGAHVMIIHHSGKDATRGARGHSSLKAAVDTEIQVAKSDGVCTMTVTKQRDMGDELEMAFRWEAIEVRRDEYGEPVYSLVLKPTDQKASSRPLPKITPQHQKALDVLWNLLADEGVRGGPPPAPPIGSNRKGVLVEKWREACHALPLSTGGVRAANQAFNRAVSSLGDAGRVRVVDEYAVPLSAADRASECEQTEVPF